MLVAVVVAIAAAFIAPALFVIGLLPGTVYENTTVSPERTGVESVNVDVAELAPIDTAVIVSGEPLTYTENADVAGTDVDLIV
jgi:hypothetical protein